MNHKRKKRRMNIGDFITYYSYFDNNVLLRLLFNRPSPIKNFITYSAVYSDAKNFLNEFQNDPAFSVIRYFSGPCMYYNEHCTICNHKLLSIHSFLFYYTTRAQRVNTYNNALRVCTYTRISYIIPTALRSLPRRPCA